MASNGDDAKRANDGQGGDQKYGGGGSLHRGPLRGHVYTRLPYKLSLAGSDDIPAALSIHGDFNFSSFEYSCFEHSIQITEAWSPYRTITLDPADWLTSIRFFESVASGSNVQMALLESSMFYLSINKSGTEPHPSWSPAPPFSPPQANSVQMTLLESSKFYLSINKSGTEPHPSRSPAPPFSPPQATIAPSVAAIPQGQADSALEGKDVAGSGKQIESIELATAGNSCTLM